MPPTRKVIQLIPGNSSVTEAGPIESGKPYTSKTDGIIFALCDDGTVWSKCGTDDWKQEIITT